MKNFGFWMFFVVCVAGFISCGQKSNHPQVIFETGMGNFTVELYPDKAPKTVAAFLQNVTTGQYNPGSFYRVIKNENLSAEYNRGLIQGGIYKTKPDLVDRLPKIPHESPSITGISHTDGTISMARTDTGTARTEFFICIGNQTKYDSSKATNPDGQGMAAFGRVIEGMDVVRKIQARPSYGERFESDAAITRIFLK